MLVQNKKPLLKEGEKRLGKEEVLKKTEKIVKKPLKQNSKVRKKLSKKK